MSTKAVRHAVIALLAGINGATGGYSVDLSAVDGASRPVQVLAGKYLRPPATVPFACVWVQQVDEDSSVVLSKREQTGTLMVRAWAAATPKDIGARQDIADDLMDDLRRALRASPTLSGTVIRFTAAATSWEDEQSTDKQTYAQVLLAITAIWRES